MSAHAWLGMVRHLHLEVAAPSEGSVTHPYLLNRGCSHGRDSESHFVAVNMWQLNVVKYGSSCWKDRRAQLIPASSELKIQIPNV